MAARPMPPWPAGKTGCSRCGAQFAGGCHLNRDIPDLLEAAGFACPTLHTRYLSGPRVMTFNYWGEARAA